MTQNTVVSGFDCCVRSTDTSPMGSMDQAANLSDVALLLVFDTTQYSIGC